MYFTLGTIFGLCLMYFGGLVIDWMIERRDGK